MNLYLFLIPVSSYAEKPSVLAVKTTTAMPTWEEVTSTMTTEGTTSSTTTFSATTFTEESSTFPMVTTESPDLTTTLMNWVTEGVTKTLLNGSNPVVANSAEYVETDFSEVFNMTSPVTGEDPTPQEIATTICVNLTVAWAGIRVLGWGLDLLYSKLVRWEESAKFRCKFE